MSLAQSILSSIVRMFRRAGARCRKSRGRYVCSSGSVKAVIDNYRIKILVEGELRGEYGYYKPEDVYSEEAFMDSLKNASGADDVYLEFPSQDIYLCLEYSIDNADKAVKAFEKMARHGFSIAITNLEGELRLYSDGKPASTGDWLSILES